jgi:hypothetical protein
MSGIGISFVCVTDAILLTEINNRVMKFLESNGDVDIVLEEVNQMISESSDHANVFNVTFSADEGMGIIEVVVFSNNTYAVTEI